MQHEFEGFMVYLWFICSHFLSIEQDSCFHLADSFVGGDLAGITGEGNKGLGGAS